MIVAPEITHVTAPPPQFLRVENVAQACGVSAKTVYRWLHDGLPHHRPPGAGSRGILLVSRTDLDSWLRRYRHDPAAAAPQKLTLNGRRFIDRRNRLDAT